MLINSLHIAGQSLSTSSLGIQVTGQNLANANTQGYVREQLLLNTVTGLNVGGVVIGDGVKAGGVVQMIDEYLELRMNNSYSDAAGSSIQAQYYMQLESLLAELGEVDISSSLDAFFNSIEEILNHPEDVSYRQMAIGKGQGLADDIRNISARLIDIRMSINQMVENTADEINRLTQQIAMLNVTIAEVEAGRSPGSEALGLRDQRLRAVTDLSQLINIKTTEDKNTGMLTVVCGSDVLVMDGVSREVFVDYQTDPYDQLSLAVVRMSKTGNLLGVTSGELAGLYVARDTIIGGYSQSLDDFAEKLVESFNTIYSSGQGLTGYSEITSVNVISQTNVSLLQAGLTFSPQNGSLEILVQNMETGIATTNEILIPLGATVSHDMTLEDFVAALNTIEGIAATINPFNQVEITSTSPNLQFAFANDTSGLLKSLGLNTFFVGSDARTIGVNTMLKSDPGKFAASQNGIGYDTDIAVSLSAMPETPLSSLGNVSITGYYRVMNNKINTESAKSQAIAKGNLSYFSSLSAQRAAISGVNIDEETINMMTFQRSYQASAKLVTTLNTLFDSLIAM